MKEKNFILATAGHIDHGKSALVKALTGTDPDRLPEEKARGITIELGFAELLLNEFRVGVVDVPGHEDFVKSMVAGVGAIDLALLVIAADDGWMPQTEEHLQILEYLGVERAVVALTKIDLVGSIAAVEESIRSQLQQSAFRDAPIIPVSIASGQGVERLRAELTARFSLALNVRDSGKPRLAVDRAFVLQGIGTVVTGTLTGGRFRRGESVVIQPRNLPAKIRAIQSHNREQEEVGPGRRVALNLPELAVDAKTCGISRGDIVTNQNADEPHAIVDAVVTRSSRLPRQAKPLKSGATLRVHYGSASFPAQVFLSGRNELHAGETALAELRFAQPVFVFTGDRFVLRDSSERTTLAGGTVLDPEADPSRFRSESQREFLTRRAQFSLSAELLWRTLLARDHVVASEHALAKSQCSREEIIAALSELTRRGEAIVTGKTAIEANWWKRQRERAAALVDDEHRLHPQRTGMEIAQLRRAMPLSNLELFDALIDELTRDGFERIGEIIRRKTHQPSLPPSLQAAGERVRAGLAEKPFDPPSRAEVAPDDARQQALQFFCDTGEVIELSPEIVLARSAFETMRDRVVEFLKNNDAASVSELRHALGSTRRLMIPLLEYLDRQAITRRIGDRRVLNLPAGRD